MNEMHISFAEEHGDNFIGDTNDASNLRLCCLLCFLAVEEYFDVDCMNN
jgi:hypothetical protein